ncbi:MAG: hypothetical protein KAH38_09780 [Candidatus Hydrogenedentes bacterium]|nr:hypothetical protein [Candidatus Hydrogenedentota bacterium]
MTIEERIEQMEKEIVRLNGRVLELEGALERDDGKVKDVLRASRFELVDDTGNVRATLDFDEYGTRLILQDSKGNLRVGLHALASGSGLALADGAGKVRIKLGVFNNRPEIVLFDGEGKDRILLAATENFGPHMSLFDKNGKDRVVMVVVDHGPAIVMSDEDGKTVWAVPDSQPRWLSH